MICPMCAIGLVHQLYVSSRSILLQYKQLFIHKNSVPRQFYFLAAVEICFAEESYTVSEAEYTVAINLRVTGKYFVFMNATVSCTEGSATSENDV